MEEALKALLSGFDLGGLAIVIVVSIVALGWGADWLVQEAVALSERSGIPKVVIGATVVSLGTTTPEAAVSVMAAMRGDPGMALGNAVGSIICDTGLVLGVACLVGPLPLPRHIVNRQGWVQFGAALLLIAASWPLASPLSPFQGGKGRIEQWWGFVFLALLALYLWQSVRWARKSGEQTHLEELEADVRAPLAIVLGKLAVAVVVVVVASSVLIEAVKLAAARIGMPEEIIAATIVAAGTSLPEFVTGVTAARRGHGDLAVGNVVGADILNALFVTGAAAAATREGLEVSSEFYEWLFPFMLGILVLFRVGVFCSKDRLNVVFGGLLLAAYASYLTALVVRAAS
ncbi:MAG: sodium:calcium antiporter [Planctomycetes bacterium]|nr:sodium:calcium antiporter [Planctomycetota bacterium]